MKKALVLAFCLLAGGCIWCAPRKLTIEKTDKLIENPACDTGYGLKGGSFGGFFTVAGHAIKENPEMMAKEFGSVIAIGTNPVAGFFKIVDLMRYEQNMNQ